MIQNLRKRALVRSDFARRLFIPAGADVIRAGDYADLWSGQGRGDHAFAGVPLATLSGALRGNILEKVARRDEELSRG